MRLINVKTHRLEEYIGRNIPPYAILSHCWGEEETSFQEMQEPSTPVKKFAKIQDTCQLASNNNINYVWIDTCCIDKISSAELSEAINSMFEWYTRATVCYAFLHDLDPRVETEVGLQGCKWFTRGWTLQELLAPRDVRFYDASWNFRGTKSDLVGTISDITRIHPSYLVGTTPLLDSLGRTHAAVKMSWMSHRMTTRVEDIAYCLLGLFNVNMPLLYGEGPKAFQRLQEEILVKDGDLSVLAWKPKNPTSRTAGVLATSPSEFSWVRESNLEFSVFVNRKECSITSWGLRLRSQLLQEPVSSSNESNQPPYFRYVLDLDAWAWTMREDPPVWLKSPRLNPNRKDISFGIYLRKHGDASYCRDFTDTSNSLAVYDPTSLPFKRCPIETLFMHIRSDSLPYSHWTSFPNDPFGNTDDVKIQQIGVYFPEVPGVDIVDVANEGLWDASNRLLLCTYYRRVAIVTMKLTDTVYNGMSDFLLVLAPLHIYQRVQICLLDPGNTAQYLLKNVAQMSDKDLKFPELGLSLGASAGLRSKNPRRDITCVTSEVIIPSMSHCYTVLRLELRVIIIPEFDLQPVHPV